MVPSLLDAYRLERTAYDEALVLRDPQQHLSLRRDVDLMLRRCRRCAPILGETPEASREMVRVAGFGEFVGVLTRASNDSQVVRAIAERWWDKTNSFHFSFGEMTVTPMDFAAITGLRVGGDPIPYDAAAGRDPELQRRLLGYRLRAEKGDAPYAQLLVFLMEPSEGRVQEEQMARCFLLYVLSASLFPNRCNRVHLSFLPALRNIGEITRFNWGGAALGACYAFMGSLSRGVGKSLGGYWRV
ncbi:protein MAIN-LIKE 2-like [Rhododendron vialii]|uniref:protein MAIN-LIKE 2-like n=1 Tax=Rhododendron vialii TaxID=182163 RepID=UPI0026603217|nr:protein MAIN-LIKE 2-like [Rhododendron vialii]